MGEDIVIGLAHQLAAEGGVAFGAGGEEAFDQVAVGHDELHDVVTLGVGGDYG